MIAYVDQKKARMGKSVVDGEGGWVTSGPVAESLEGTTRVSRRQEGRCVDHRIVPAFDDIVRVIEVEKRKK